MVAMLIPFLSWSDLRRVAERAPVRHSTRRCRVGRHPLDTS
jgi:hypothetical protein